jgi:hypothetical protein
VVSGKLVVVVRVCQSGKISARQRNRAKREHVTAHHHRTFPHQHHHPSHLFNQSLNQSLIPSTPPHHISIKTISFTSSLTVAVVPATPAPAPWTRPNHLGARTPPRMYKSCCMPHSVDRALGLQIVLDITTLTTLSISLSWCYFLKFEVRDLII